MHGCSLGSKRRRRPAVKTAPAETGCLESAVAGLVSQPDDWSAAAAFTRLSSVGEGHAGFQAPLNPGEIALAVRVPPSNANRGSMELMHDRALHAPVIVQGGAAQLHQVPVNLPRMLTAVWTWVSAWSREYHGRPTAGLSPLVPAHGRGITSEFVGRAFARFARRGARAVPLP